MTLAIDSARKILDAAFPLVVRTQPNEEMELRLDQLEQQDEGLYATLTLTVCDVSAAGKKAIRDIKEQSCQLVPAAYTDEERVRAYLETWSAALATFITGEITEMLPYDFTLSEALDDATLQTRDDFARVFGSFENIAKLRATHNEASLAPLMPELVSYVHQQVRAGFRDDESIVMGACDYLGDRVPVDVAETAARVLDAEKSELRNEQASWPALTDCDCLDYAFKILEEGGIVARQNFTCCQNCGHAEIGDEIGDRKVRGYTFYHQQDTERAVEGGGLLLAFGATTDEPNAALEVGESIKNILEASGLRVSWDGSTQKRIGIDLEWKKRRAS